MAVMGCLIDAGEVVPRVKKVTSSRCLSTCVCGRHIFIEPFCNMVAHTYFCWHMVAHTYVYRHVYMCGIHIFVFLLAILMPRYVYLYICIGCTNSPDSQ